MRFRNKKGEMNWWLIGLVLALLAGGIYAVAGGRIWGSGFNELRGYTDCGNFVSGGVCLENRDSCLDLYGGTIRPNNKDCEKTDFPVCCASPKFEECEKDGTKGVCLTDSDCSNLEGSKVEGVNCETSDTVCCSGTKITK
jgi:hypothetical protein